MANGTILFSVKEAYDLEGHKKSYLVDGGGKLVYYFLPHGSFAVPTSSKWPEPSKLWVQLWRPIVVNNTDEISLGKGYETHKLQGVQRVEDGANVGFHVCWGGENTVFEKETIAFWRLYTFAYDKALVAYPKVDHGTTPGHIQGVWHPVELDGGAPAPQNLNLLDPDYDGPVTSFDGGGP